MPAPGVLLFIQVSCNIYTKYTPGTNRQSQYTENTLRVIASRESVFLPFENPDQYRIACMIYTKHTKSQRISQQKYTNEQPDKSGNLTAVFAQAPKKR